MKPAYFTKGFKAFLMTQMLGAFNDNFFKMLLSLYLISILQMPNSEELLFQASLAFTAPFLIFGPWSGYLADRYAKTKVLQISKAVEIPIMMLGTVAVASSNPTFMIAILFLMASQSAFFSLSRSILGQ